MTAVLSYPTFERKRFNTEIAVSTPAVPEGATVTVRLSPFHVPLAVSLAISADKDTCSYIFDYANDEPGERTLTQVPGDPDVLLLLGKNSGKILRLTFQNASARLENGEWTFDARRLFSVEEGEHSRTRNPELIQRVIETTPPSLMREIRKHLRN